MLINIRNDPAVAMLWGRKKRCSKPKKSPRIRERNAIVPQVLQNGVGSDYILESPTGRSKIKQAPTLNGINGQISPLELISSPLQKSFDGGNNRPTKKANNWNKLSPLYSKSPVDDREMNLDMVNGRQSDKKVSNPGFLSNEDFEWQNYENLLSGRRKPKRKRRDWCKSNCSPREDTGIATKKGSPYALKTGAIKAIEVKDMNLSQLHSLRKELNLNWHSKISKTELQRRLIVYLKRAEVKNLKKSSYASHWTPPIHSPNPHHTCMPWNSQVLERDSKSPSSLDKLGNEGLGASSLNKDLTDSKPKPKVISRKCAPCSNLNDVDDGLCWDCSESWVAKSRLSQTWYGDKNRKDDFNNNSHTVAPKPNIPKERKAVDMINTKLPNPPMGNKLLSQIDTREPETKFFSKDLNSSGSKTQCIGMSIDSPDVIWKPSIECRKSAGLGNKGKRGDIDIPSPEASNVSHQLKEIMSLRARNKQLQYDLEKSEELRLGIEAKLNSLQETSEKDSIFGKLLNAKRVRWFGIQDDEKAGMLWNLEDNIQELKCWDRWLANMKHSSRDGVESPVAMISKKEWETMSCPLNESLKFSLANINETLFLNCNLVGHLVVRKEEV